MKKVFSLLFLFTFTFLFNYSFADANGNFINSHSTKSFSKSITLKNDTSNTSYTIDLKNWGIYNDGTHAVETTKGINAAIKWAGLHGYKTVYVPSGTYLISKGSLDNNPDSQSINLISDLTLQLDKNTVFKKETNGLESYSVVYIGVGVKNATLKGGTLLGDRDTHDYSQKEGDWSSGTHEWGYGVNIAGGRNITIDGVSIKKMTGDGITVGGSTVEGSYYINESDLELGGIDDKGNLIEQTGKIRTKAFKNFSSIKDSNHRVVNIWLPENLTSKDFYVYYYDQSGKFIRKDYGRVYSNYSTAPVNAYSYKIVFNASSTNGVTMNMMSIENAKGVVIKNNDIGYNRRQGITANGEDVQILNNTIHHTSGTPPQSGIDIEPGFFPAINHLIKGNKFLDNKIQIVGAYGEGVIIDGNYFEQTSAVHGGVGVSIASAFRGVKAVNNNTFKGSSLVLWATNSTANNNNFTNTGVNLLGENQTFTNATFNNAQLGIGNEKNQSASNLKFNQIGEVGNDQSSLYIWGVPTVLKNVTINADQTGKRIPGIIQGYGNSDSVYQNLTVIDKAQKGTILVAGKYFNPVLNTGGLGINREGSYLLNGAKITGNSSLLRVDKTYGQAPEVTITNSTLVLNKEVGYAAALYVLGAKKFDLINSSVYANNATVKYNPIIKVGPYGYPKPTNINEFSMKNTILYTKPDIVGLDTSNAGTDATPYTITDNTIYNAKFILKKNDISLNNRFLKK